MNKISCYQFGVYKPSSGKGVSEYLYLLSELIKEDLDFNFVVFDPNASEDFYKCEQIDGISIHHFGRLKKMFSVYPQLPKGFVEWLKKLSGQRGVVFHLHSVFRLSNFVLSRTLVKFNIPYLFTPHDSYSRESLKKRWLIKRLFLSTFEKYILDHAKTVHAITRDGIDSIARYTKNRVHFVSNFILDKSGQYATDAVSNTICFIGRFDIYQKGIDIQLKAYDEFLKKTGKRIPFVLIGGYSDAEKARFDALKNATIAPELIEATGFIALDEKYRHLSRCYLYFQPSRFEGFGLSIVEALSFGKPVIISPQVPIKDTVLKYGAGRIVRNAQEAAEALDEMYTYGKKEYRERSVSARRCYEENYHPDVVKPLMLNMFEESISE